jgi:serine/threonine protein kinase
MSNIESNLKKLLKGEKACIPEHFLKVPSYNSPTLRTGKGKPLSEGAFGKMYRGSINDNGRRYVAYKEIDTSESTDGAFEFEFKVAEKLKEFAVPEMYLFKKCPIQYKTPKKVRKTNGTLVDLGAFPKRTKPKDILYMELLDGMSFNSWWKTKPSLDAIKSVIVQVFDNLYRINQEFPDFRHRDLHGGNVMVNPNVPTTPYTWKVDLGRKVIRNDPGGSFRSRLGSPDIKKYERTNAGVEAHIIDFGLSYWSRRMPNPETKGGGYEGAGIYGHGIGPGTIYYDIHRFLYIIYVKVRQPENAKERAIKNFIEELVPNKEFLQFNGKFTSQGYLLSDYHVALRANLPTFKTILTHPFLTGEKTSNRPKTVAEALKMIAPKPKPKPKTPPKAKTPKAKTPSPKLSTEERKKKMNSAIKRAAAVLAANKNKPKAKLAPRRRPGAVRPNPVPEIQPASPSPKANAPYGVMSPSNIMEYARKIESGRKKAANKLNAKIKEIKATKGKTPTPVRLKEKFSFVNVKGKKREFVRKFAYDRALAKNKAEREKTPTPKAKTPTPEEAGKEWNKRYKETFGITFKEIPNYVMPPAAHNRHMGMINNRREYVNDRTKGKTPSFGYIATTAERAKEAKAKAKAKTPTPKAKKNEYWRSFVDVNGKKQEFESKSAYHEAKQKNLQAYAAKFQKKINNQIEMGRKARLNPQKYSFVDWYGRKREYVRKGAYEKALAKNKAFRVEMAKPTFSERALVKRQQRGQPFYMMTPQNVRNAIQGGKNMKFVGGSKGFKTVTPKAKTVTPKVKTPTPKKAVNMYINKFVNKLDKDEVNALKKKICQP